MPFRDPALGERIRQGNLAAKRDLDVNPVGTDAGAARAKAMAMQPWVKGDVGSRPAVTSAPAPFTGQQPFSELRAANQPLFDEWGDRFFGGTSVGASFLAPPPEPAPETAPAKEEG